VGRLQLGGGDPNFAPQEAEEMVRELRAHLRMEQRLRENGEVEGAARQRLRALSTMGELARRLELRFQGYARAYFGDTPQLIEEAIAEMFAELCRRLFDTSPTNELMERRFNYVVKMLIIDAIRTVRGNNELTREHGDPDTVSGTGERYEIFSMEAANERAESAVEGERVARPLFDLDPQAEEPYQRIVDRMLGKQALRWLTELPARQRAVVEYRILEGMQWPEVSERVGVTPRMAQIDLKEALNSLRARYAQQQKGGE
jgi:RNA polymerase sigma factor (sigma-70 family)